MRIQHNIMAMNAYRNYTTNTSAVAKNLEKLSSGYRINRAGDDAAGLAISEKMRAQITGLSAAQKNVKDGISLVKTAEGATQEIHDMLNRMVYLAEQSSNGTYQNEVDREAITNEFNQLKAEINRIADSSNFNGIKLLDGSLATEGVADAAEVKIKGVISNYSVGAAGKYSTTAVKGSDLVNSTTSTFLTGEGDTFTYTVSLDNGSSYSVKFTSQFDDKGNQSLVAEDGTAYPGTKTTGTGATQKSTIQATDVDRALLSELQKTKLSDDYIISSDGAMAFSFEAKSVGTSVPGVAAVDYTSRNAATGEVKGNDTGKNPVTVVTSPRDVGFEIKADDITEYDGTNYEDAVFTINGKKFVLLTNTMDGQTDTTNDAYLRAVQSLGKDVTVLVGGRGGLKKADPGTAPVQGDAANGNFNQNIKAIAKATGLTVTDAIDEATATGAAAGEGIRLSAGKGSLTGGLTLQIGDTSDSFNQLTVSIKDMHAKALGIADLDLGTQTGAQAAVATIKDAINYVSDVRGTLGATQNRLEHTSNNLSVMKENIQDAESSIRDTDIAEEMMAYTKNNILVQSAQAMLAQANQLPQGVLQLLG